MNHRLKVMSVEDNQKSTSPTRSKGTRRQEIEATMERLWLEDPEQFNPERDAVQRKRISGTLSAIKDHVSLQNKRCADLGCGGGTLSLLLRDAGAKVDAVDIASQALNILKSKDMHHITAIKDCLPSSRLEDSIYNLVVCTEMIGFLEPKEYRLLFAELSRLVSKEGIAVCSTSLDTNSENALERFASLAETEFEIDKWVLRYDLLWLKLCWFFEAPEAFIKAYQDNYKKKKELEKRKRLSKFWFKINSSMPMVLLWRLVHPITKRVAFTVRQSDSLVNFLEKITKFIWDESGISHALFIGKLRPMTFPLPANEIPIEMKHKRQVWD